MLVISRKAGEVIDLDGGISIQIVRIGGKTVRVGITAPDGVGIRRREITLMEQENGLTAGRPATDSAD